MHGVHGVSTGANYPGNYLVISSILFCSEGGWTDRSPWVRRYLGYPHLTLTRRRICNTSKCCEFLTTQGISSTKTSRHCIGLLCLLPSPTLDRATSSPWTVPVLHTSKQDIVNHHFIHRDLRRSTFCKGDTSPSRWVSKLLASGDVSPLSSWLHTEG